MDLRVINVDSNTGKVTFGFGIGTPKKVTGINKLAQIAIVKLLNSTGRDIFEPEKGGGLLSLIGGNINPNDMSEIVAEITPRVKRVNDQMLDEQVNLDLPQEERLRTLRLVDVYVDPDDITGYNVDVEIISEAEDTSRVTIETALLSGS